MNWTANHTKLRDTLAQLYLERADALRISTEAGLNPATISFNDRAINTWHEIITKASAQDLLIILIERALSEFPKNSVLREALDAFRIIEIPNHHPSMANFQDVQPAVEHPTMASSEDIAHQQTLLTTYRRNLAHYLKQQATLGEAYTPPGVVHGIIDARSHIQRIKQILRGWNVAVENHPDDSDSV